MTEPTFTEAPASVNLKFDYRGYESIQLTLRAETGQDVLAKLDGAISHLEKIGAKPAANGYNKPKGKAPASARVNGAMCPEHGVRLAQSKHNANQLYCPKQLGLGPDGKKLYCEYKVDAMAALDLQG